MATPWNQDVVAPQMSSSLLSKLQLAVLEHEAQRYSTQEGRTLRYLSNFLLRDVEDDALVHEDSFKNIFMELSNLLSPQFPPSPPQDPRSSHIAAKGPRVLRPMLLQCAHALSKKDVSQMLDVVRAIRQGASSSRLHDQVALCFVDALMARLMGAAGQRDPVFRSTGVPQVFANMSILERCTGANRVHIVDYGIDNGHQWVPLIKAFSERPEGPPQVTITGIDHPLFVKNDTGILLFECAKQYGVDLVYESISTDAWEAPSPFVWRTRDEVVIVQCLIKSCYIKEDGVHLQNPRKLWLQKIHKMNPSLFIQSENAGSINGPFFLRRFQQALSDIFVDDMYSYCTSLHGTSEQVVRVAKPYIMNYVAYDDGCLIRPSSYKEWSIKVKRAGFKPVQASATVSKMLRAHVKPLGLSVREEEHWLVLGYKEIDNYAVCLWKPV